jgi:hypothetical protein
MSGSLATDVVQSNVKMELDMQWAEEKNRRDYFFCKVACLNFEEGQSDTGGWVVVPEAARKTGYSEDEIQLFLDRLVEDGWIEVKDSTQSISSRVRLTLAGRARAQVICKAHH